MSQAGKSRPQMRNIRITQIVTYRMPFAALVSITHRISGFLMFLLLPFILFLLDKSLTSEISFEYLKGFTSHWFVKLVILGVSWAYLHHLCAGIRHLSMDLHFGLSKDGCRRSAVAVFSVSIPLAMLVALKLFGVF
jgi:succinate dehydrogenase / fumarate reductase cytochrome b subunit